jgi:hypothetical protein
MLKHFIMRSASKKIAPVSRAEPRQGHAAIGDPKKLPGLVERRSEVRRLLEEFKSSERHVCELMAVPRSSGRYLSRRDGSLVQERLRELAREHPRFGYRRLHLYHPSRWQVSPPSSEPLGPFLCTIKPSAS